MMFLAIFQHNQRMTCISLNSLCIDTNNIWICSTNSCTITGRKRSMRIFVPEYWYPGVFWEVNQAPLLQILANAAGILGGWTSMQFGIIDRANKRWLQYTLCKFDFKYSVCGKNECTISHWVLNHICLCKVLLESQYMPQSYSMALDTKGASKNIMVLFQSVLNRFPWEYAHCVGIENTEGMVA
jgi:hypothetical protein